jgi:hypothetical protein
MLSNLQDKTDEIRGILLDDIDKILDNQLKLDKIEDDTTELQTGAKDFKKKAKTFKNAMIARFMFYIILLFLVICVNYI